MSNNITSRKLLFLGLFLVAEFWLIAIGIAGIGIVANSTNLFESNPRTALPLQIILLLTFLFVGIVVSIGIAVAFKRYWIKSVQGDSQVKISELPQAEMPLGLALLLPVYLIAFLAGFRVVTTGTFLEVLAVSAQMSLALASVILIWKQVKYGWYAGAFFHAFASMRGMLAFAQLAYAYTHLQIAESKFLTLRAGFLLPIFLHAMLLGYYFTSNVERYFDVTALRFNRFLIMVTPTAVVFVCLLIINF
jgi:hypothetical protein